jgi:TetR/AcrR family transcriptional regulator, cholesterol catabolism regulator
MTQSERATTIAAGLFATKGYAATTTREIAEALGVTKGTFYHHFPSKEDVLLEICEQSLSRITEAAVVIVEGTDEPRVRLESLIRSHIHTMLADQGMHTTMLLELRSLGVANRDRVVASRDAYEALIRDAISECQAAGALDADADTRLLALLLLNLLNWTIFWYRPGGAHTVDEIADASARMFLQGSTPSR